jgi:hypothetical protein
MNEELLPCPFCGNEAYFEKMRLDENSFVQVKCRSIFCRLNFDFPHFCSREEATKAWNRRITLNWPIALKSAIQEK